MANCRNVFAISFSMRLGCPSDPVFVTVAVAVAVAVAVVEGANFYRIRCTYQLMRYITFLHMIFSSLLSHRSTKHTQIPHVIINKPYHPAVRLVN